MSINCTTSSNSFRFCVLIIFLALLGVSFLFDLWGTSSPSSTSSSSSSSSKPSMNSAAKQNNKNSHPEWDTGENIELPSEERTAPFFVYPSSNSAVTVPSGPIPLPALAELTHPAELRGFPDPLTHCSRAAELYINGSFHFGWTARPQRVALIDPVIPPRHVNHNFKSVGCYYKTSVFDDEIYSSSINNTDNNTKYGTKDETTQTATGDAGGGGGGVGAVLWKAIEGGTQYHVSAVHRGSIALEIATNLVPETHSQYCFSYHSLYDADRLPLIPVPGILRDMTRIAFLIRRSREPHSEKMRRVNQRLRETNSLFYDDWVRSAVDATTKPAVAVRDNKNNKNLNTGNKILPPSQQGSSSAEEAQETMKSAESIPRDLLSPLYGDVVFVTLQMKSFWGQTFQQAYVAASRIYTSGLMRNTTTIVFNTLSEKRTPMDLDMIGWLAPYLPGPLLRANFNKIYWAKQRAHFVQIYSEEHSCPCAQLFSSEYMLPRVLHRLRWFDKAFSSKTAVVGGDDEEKWGDTRPRFARAVSDQEWFASLPKKIFILKDKTRARGYVPGAKKQNAHVQRAFDLTPRLRDFLASQGFVFVSDSAPLDHRLLLVNAAEVVLTTYGALAAMLSRLYGGLGPSRDASQRRRRDSPMRWILLVPPGYHRELRIHNFRPHRAGVQAGLDVTVSNETWLMAQFNSWTKTIVVPGNDLMKYLRPEHLDFSLDDCFVFDERHESATNSYVARGRDFHSRVRRPDAVRYRPSRLLYHTRAAFDEPRRAHIPGFGHCFVNLTARGGGGGGGGGGRENGKTSPKAVLIDDDVKLFTGVKRRCEGIC